MNKKLLITGFLVLSQTCTPLYCADEKEILIGASVMALPTLFSQTKPLQWGGIKWGLTNVGAYFIGNHIIEQGLTSNTPFHPCVIPLVALHTGHQTALPKMETLFGTIPETKVWQWGSAIQLTIIAWAAYNYNNVR